MKIFNVDQIREADKFTIENEPVSSLMLMERAGVALTQRFIQLVDVESSLFIVCGPGNNGGDGLVMARLLANEGFHITVLIGLENEKSSPENLHNLNLVNQISEISVIDFSTFDVSEIKKSNFPVVIDAMFGSGLDRPISGFFADLILKINQVDVLKIAIDIPSGLFADRLNDPKNVVFCATHTLTIEFPKLSFLFVENSLLLGSWDVVSINLHPDFVNKTYTPHFFTTEFHIRQILKPRSRVSHKGDFGRALLIAGSYGMMGASVFAAKSCLRSGVGLLKVHIPKCGYQILQTSIPEAMAITDESEFCFSAIHLDSMGEADALAIGCGLGKREETASALKQVIQSYRKPMVIDADALNIISENKTWLSFLPTNSILTPHVKEFERLVGKSSNSFERLTKLKEFAIKYRVVVVLKGANTAIATPEGEVFFNSTGNSGMSTAGCGDVLTGIILGLLSQGYSSVNASILGVYIHGLAADIAISKHQSMESLIASDIIDHLGAAFQTFHAE